MNPKSSYICTDLFIKWFTEHFLKHKPSGKVLLILDGHTSHSSSPVLLQIAVQNDIIVICLPSHCTHALQPLDKCFFGPLKSYFKKEAAAWMKQNPQRKITRYQMGRLIGFAWNKADSVGVGVSAFESTGIYPFNPNTVPEHFFSISDTSETTTCIDTAPRNVAPMSAPSTSGTTFQNVLSTPAAPSTSNLNTVLSSDTSPDEISPSKRLRKISPVPKIPQKKLNCKEATGFCPH
jgi:hypothetical protein